MRVNLIAKKGSKLLTIDWTRLIITLLIVCISFGLGFNFFLMRNKVNILKQEVNLLDEQLNTYLPRQKEYLNFKNKLKKLQKKPEINTSKYLWDRSLIELGYIIPPGSVLTGMKMTAGNISFNGRTGESKKLLQIKNRMESSPFFKEVTITKINKQKDIIFNIKAGLSEGGG